MESAGSLRNSEWTWGIATALVLSTICLLLGYNGLYGQDSYAYYNDAGDLRAFLEGGQRPGYFFWTRMFSGFGALLSFGFGDARLPMQGISIASLSGIVVVVVRWCRDRYGDLPFTGPLAMVCVGLSPYLMRNGVSIMSDCMAIFLTVLALWLGTRYMRDPRGKTFAGAVMVAGLAVMTRYPMAFLLAIPGIVWCWTALRSGRARHLGWLGLLGLAVIPEFVMRPGDYPPPPWHYFMYDWTPLNWFRRDFTNPDGNYHYPLPNLLYAAAPFAHPGFLGVGAVGAISLLFPRKLGFPKDGLLLLAPAILYILFLAALPYQNQRFLIPTVPLIFVAYLPALSRLMGHVRRPALVGAICMVGLGVQLTLVAFAGKAILGHHRREKHMAEALLAYPGATVLTMGMEPVLQAYRIPVKVRSFFTEDIDSLAPGTLVLTDLPAKRTQWEGFRPIRNWDHISKHYQLTLIAQYPEDWNLYAAH